MVGESKLDCEAACSSGAGGAGWTQFSVVRMCAGAVYGRRVQQVRKAKAKGAMWPIPVRQAGQTQPAKQGRSACLLCGAQPVLAANARSQQPASS